MTRCATLLLLQCAWLLAQAPAATPRAQLESAMATARSGHLDTAVKQFESILRAAPPLEIAGQAHLELARIYQRRSDWQQAAVEWAALRKLAPNEPEYAYQLGMSYQYLAKWAFERMHSIAPQSARTQQMLGEQLAVIGKQEQAIAAFERAIAAEPQLAGSHLALAMIYLQADKREAALAEIDRELELTPENAAAKQLRQAVAGAKP